MKIELEFGALAPNFTSQLIGQIDRYSLSDMARFQEYADAIVCLHVGGLLPDSAVARLRRALMKRITANLKKGITQ